MASPKARFITFFKTRLIKSYLNRQLVTNPIYLIMASYYRRSTKNCIPRTGRKFTNSKQYRSRSAGACALPEIGRYIFADALNRLFS